MSKVKQSKKDPAEAKAAKKLAFARLNGRAAETRAFEKALKVRNPSLLKLTTREYCAVIKKSITTQGVAEAQAFANIAGLGIHAFCSLGSDVVVDTRSKADVGSYIKLKELWTEFVAKPLTLSDHQYWYDAEAGKLTATGGVTFSRFVGFICKWAKKNRKKEWNALLKSLPPKKKEKLLAKLEKKSTSKTAAAVGKVLEKIAKGDYEKRPYLIAAHGHVDHYSKMYVAAAKHPSITVYTEEMKGAKDRANQAAKTADIKGGVNWAVLESELTK